MSKASYDPVGKSSPHTANGHDAESGDNNGPQSKSGGGTGSGNGFTVRIRRMERRNWFILAGAGVLVALVVIVAVVLVMTSQHEEEQHGGVRSGAMNKNLIMDPDARKQARPASCNEEPDPGMCRAYFEKYFYNATTDSCEMFVYGGCDGNANNFGTIAECERDCLAGVITEKHEQEIDAHDGPAGVKETAGNVDEKDPDVHPAVAKEVAPADVAAASKSADAPADDAHKDGVVLEEAAKKA